ncbi:glycosyltransferase [Desulfobacca acetoxidans]|uniref:Glycosyl transferase family 2 n=1 Tax=Desulfobacca acetoxidans (strain ATCC 700848 / DSM 11109 / ASRB2) TaxID=880072 RepID=F2NC93_DESAR|nr:glycosyltransferase [Desulfobacca acetoxidans]AEB08888.1 glycosyl transferase family 2 [Desulfobacca acetoxidans DSM 11109]
MNLIAALFASLCFCALVYQFSAIIALICFRRRPLPSCQSGVWPGISLLKPVRGLEQDSYDCLASFIRQDYPARQILFGVADPTDPILPLLRDLQATFGEVDIRVVICPQELGMNPKVSTLRQLLPLAVYDYILISDSDVRVRPDALRVLAGALQDPKAGLATCLYRPGPVDTNGAALEAMTISTDFIPSVAMAYYVEDIRFALGAVMALSQETLERIGGFEGIADHLADDYQLGLRVSEAGLQVQLLPYVEDRVIISKIY